MRSVTKSGEKPCENQLRSWIRNENALRRLLKLAENLPTPPLAKKLKTRQPPSSRGYAAVV